MKREIVGDDLDQLIAETVAEHPEFEEMLDAAIAERADLRAAQAALTDPENQGAPIPWEEIEAELDARP